MSRARYQSLEKIAAQVDADIAAMPRRRDDLPRNDMGDPASLHRLRSASARPAAWPELDALPEPTDDEPAPFPFDGLGKVLGEAGRTITDCVQAPDALAGGAVLAAAAVIAQALVGIKLPHGQVVPASVFVVSSADSGARKSGVDQVACFPIEERRRTDARNYAEKLTQFKADKAARKPGDGGDDPPAAHALTVSKGTTEGLHHLLRVQSHVGLFSPEGAELVGGHSLREDKRSAGIAWLLKAWGGETLDNLTRGDGLSVLIGRRLSMHVLMQQVILGALMRDPLAQGQGWIARCLVASPRTLAGGRYFRDGELTAPETPEVQRYYRALTDLLAVKPSLHPSGDGHELMPRSLTLTSDARKLWIEFYNEVEHLQGDGLALAGVRAWASKAAEHAGRIAGVVAVVEDPASQEIDLAVMDGAIKVTNFYLSEHVRLMGQSQQRQQLDRLRTLLAWMRGKGSRVAHADVLQGSPRPLRELKAKGIGELLTDLADRHYIRRDGDAWEVRRA